MYRAEAIGTAARVPFLLSYPLHLSPPVLSCSDASSAAVDGDVEVVRLLSRAISKAGSGRGGGSAGLVSDGNEGGHRRGRGCEEEGPAAWFNARED
jgi:hypothetical protein